MGYVWWMLWRRLNKANFRIASRQYSNQNNAKLGTRLESKNTPFGVFCTEIAGPGLEPINFEAGSSYDPFLEDS